MIVKLFYYIQCIKASFDDGTTSLRNLPMYDNYIKVYKNANTKVALEIKRLDRKALRITNNKLYYLNVLSKDGQINLIRKQFLPEDIDRGRMYVNIERSDLAAIQVDNYYYSVSYVDEDSNEFLLLTTQDARSNAVFQVLDNALPVVYPPFVQFEFTPVRTVRNIANPISIKDSRTLISSRLPISKPLHTLTLKMDNFTGSVTVQKTRSLDPNDQESWEDLEVFTYTENSVNEIVELEDIEASYVRIKIIKSVDNEGTFDELNFI
jgi:hypothetical protein